MRLLCAVSASTIRMWSTWPIPLPCTRASDNCLHVQTRLLDVYANEAARRSSPTNRRSLSQARSSPAPGRRVSFVTRHRSGSTRSNLREQACWPLSVSGLRWDAVPGLISNPSRLAISDRSITPTSARWSASNRPTAEDDQPISRASCLWLTAALNRAVRSSSRARLSRKRPRRLTSLLPSFTCCHSSMMTTRAYLSLTGPCPCQRGNRSRFCTALNYRKRRDRPRR